MPAPISHISFSSLSLFLASRSRWHRKYVQGIHDELATPAMVEGKAAHRFAELVLKGHDPVAARNMALAVLETAAETETVDWGETGSLEKSKDTLEKLMLVFVDARDSLDVAETVDVEADDEFRLPGIRLPVKGIIDFVYRDGQGHLVVVDWKNVRSFSDGLKPKHVIQGMLYAMIARRKYGQRPHVVRFVEMKGPVNKDGTPQFRCLDLVPDRGREALVKRLFNQAIREMSRRTALFLPNLNSLDPDEDWKAYTELYGAA